MKYFFKNEANNAELHIYDFIGDDGWGNGVTAEKVQDELNSANNKPLDIFINSNGGEVFEGFAIYNIIKRYAGQKTVYIDGIAASIASVIALAGDRVIMPTASMMMIHNASGLAIGNAEEMKKVVNALEQINETIKDIYKAKTNLSDEKLSELMDNETFMTAKECLDYGFIDEIQDKAVEPNNINSAVKSLNEMKEKYQDKIKTFNDISNVFNSKVNGGSNPVIKKTDESNKTSHWDFLRKSKGE